MIIYANREEIILYVHIMVILYFIYQGNCSVCMFICHSGPVPMDDSVIPHVCEYAVHKTLS